MLNDDFVRELKVKAEDLWFGIFAQTVRVHPGDVQQFRTNFRMLTSLPYYHSLSNMSIYEYAAAYFLCV